MSQRTEALEKAIEKMVEKIEEYPASPYTKDSTESLANAMDALESSYKIDERTGNPLMKCVIPVEIAALITRIAHMHDENDVRFHAKELYETACEIDRNYGAMLDRSEPVDLYPRDVEESTSTSLSPAELQLMQEMNRAPDAIAPPHDLQS